MEEGSEKKKSAEKPTGSPFSPFPFGSSIQFANRTPFSGSPGQRILLGRTSLLEPALASTSLLNGTDSTPLFTPRLKAQDLYGGPVMFGTSENRRNRLLSSTPYSAALRLREKDRLKSRSLSGALPPPPPATTSLASPFPHLPGTSSGTTTRPDSAPPSDSMSSTARLILDTLDKMSTPLMDARKIPVVARAEKRKALEEELNCSLGGPARRRPRLGAGPPQGTTSSALFNGSLGGPPLRKTYAPIPAATGRPHPPPPSLVLRSSGSLTAGVSLARPPSPPSPFHPASSDVSTPLPSDTAGGKIKSKVSELGKQRAERQRQEEASLLPSYLSQEEQQPRLAISPSQLPTIRLPPALPPPPPTTSSPFLLPASSSSSTTVVVSSTASTGGGKEGSWTAQAAAAAAAPEVPSSTSAPLSSAPVGGISSQSNVGFEATKTSITLKEETSTATLQSVHKRVVDDSAKIAVGPSTSNGGGVPTFPFTQLKAVSAALSTVNSVHRQFVFSKPEPAVGKLNSTPSSSAVEGGRGATSSCFLVTPPPPTAGERINNGHPQFTAGSSSSNSSSAFSLGTNGKEGAAPLLNFKSAAMPDVTNNAKLTKGVMKNNSNSLLPDLTASTTLPFGAARQLKSGSVMDILGKKA